MVRASQSVSKASPTCWTYLWQGYRDYSFLEVDTSFWEEVLHVHPERVVSEIDMSYQCLRTLCDLCFGCISQKEENLEARKNPK